VRLIAVGLLSFATAVGLSQATRSVSIVFPGEGDRETWIQDPGTDWVGQTTPTSGRGLQLEVPTEPGRTVVYVHDKSTGNVAERPLVDVLKAGAWKVGPRDERRVFRMDFLVVSNDRPVAFALVKATAGDETKTALVTPGDEGRARVHLVPVGPVKVVVEYKSGGKTRTTPPQIFEAKLGAGTPSPWKLTVADVVETLNPRSPETKRSQSRKPDSETPTPPPNPVASLANLLVGLAVIGGIVAGAVWFVKRNPRQVEDALKSLGLGGPDPRPTTAGAPAQEPAPLKPIVLDAGGAAANAAAPGPAVLNPRLVKADGSVALINEGPSEVGREAGLALSLIGESTVSRRHARLERTGDVVVLTDLGSTNGTFVNGERVTEPTTLRPGDSVQFGAVPFRFES
jgi:hypothetical protein